MENKNSIKQEVGVKGIVRMQLRDKEGNVKKLFQGNGIWEFLHKNLNLDLRVSGITGNWTGQEVVYNTITNTGLALIAKRLGGVAADPITHMGIGTGTPTATALQSEISSGGGSRAAVTPASATTTATDDTIRSVKTFTFTGSFAITEEGLFNAASSGTMPCSRSFSVINVSSGDSLQITHDIVMTAV
jgi:hypothetical protein